ncbi:MAG TPA: MerR family transcriptional regulator [Mycobacteriales bacterium]|nr:MerR family transcriptional regulator [Mycobacteriales bacterium]
MAENGTDGPAGWLTISEVARLAGITPRAIRHYHSTGLLAEPSRDGSGYRRYDASDVVAVVRVARLRALGMPIPQIAGRLTSAEPGLAVSLQALAEELDGEIERLVGTRDRILALAGSEALDQPVATLREALRSHGLVGPDEDLPAGEESAADLLDALHPEGMPGVVAQADGLLGDPAAIARLSVLVQRFRALTDDADVDGLAEEVAAVLPRPEQPAPSVDVDLMDKLLGDRLNGAQRRFLHRLRQRMETGGE